MYNRVEFPNQRVNHSTKMKPEWYANCCDYVIEAGINAKEGDIEEKFYIKPEERAQGKTSPYAFRVKKIMLLGNVTDTYVKGFSINITTSMLSPEFRENLVKLLKRNKGNVPLTMFLYDPVKKWNIEFLSHKFRVQVSLPFIEELRQMGISHSVIKK